MQKTTSQQYKELSKEQKKKNNARFLKYIFEYKGSLFLVILSTIILIAEGAAIPKLTQIIIDDWLPKSSGDIVTQTAINAIIGLIIGMLGLVIVRATGTFISTYIVRKFQQDIEMKFKEELFAKIQRLEIKFFDKVNEGFFLSRMSSDTVMAGEYARFVPENFINFTFAFSINFTFFFLYSWKIAVISIGLVILIITYTLFIKKRFKSSWATVKEKADVYNQFLVNSFSGIRETKAYTQENKQLSRYKEAAIMYKNAWRKNFKLYGEWMTINSSLLMLLPIGAIGLGAWQVIEGDLTIGAVTALTMYAGQVINPINKFLAIFDIFMRGAVSLNRIFGLLDESEEKRNKNVLNVSKGVIEFEDVYLKYEEKHALNGITFKTKPNEKIAFVGHTGSGKSTILKAIMKFYKIDKGVIKIDGKSIEEIDVINLRNNITLMSQEPYIFFDSVKSNIIFGGDVSQEEYEKAIEKSQTKDFVYELPQRDKTNIGPRGIALSGGQKQRVALARTILRNTKIILFDEATSALDNKTEKEVKKQLDLLTKNRTVIYVAHRLTTIQHVDRIFVMNKGKIVEVGTHKDLIKKKGFYYKLIKSSSTI